MFQYINITNCKIFVSLEKKGTFCRFVYLFTRSRAPGRIYLITLPTQVTDDI